MALLAVLLLFALPTTAALAGQEEESTEDVVTTTLDPGAPQPAEPDPPAEVIEIEQPWTARFLIPALVVTAILVVGGVAIYYFARIKNRYRVVQG